MAASSAIRQPSTLVAKLAIIGLVGIFWQIALPSFVSGGHGRPSRALQARTQTRVDIFEGVPFFEAFVPKEDADDVLSQRTGDNVDGRVIECDIPLGVEFEEKDNGNIFVKDVDPQSNAYDQGVRPGAQLVMISATFGEEMWPTRNCGMTQFRTVLASRFGPTIKLALENEDQGFLGGLFKSSAPKEKKLSAEEEAAKIERLAGSFEEEEAKLKSKNMWNPFR